MSKETQSTTPSMKRPTAAAARGSNGSTPAVPQLRQKGAISFRHDLYKMALAEAKKNVSYKKYVPELQQVPHTHFFHSHDMRGRPNAYCQPVAGHFHAVTPRVGPNGEMLADCGPPLRKVERTVQGGFARTVIEPVAYIDGPNQKTIVDDHRHQVDYVHSEEISPGRIQAQQRQDAAKLKELSASDNEAAQTAPAGGGGTPTGDDDGVETVVLE